MKALLDTSSLIKLYHQEEGADFVVDNGEGLEDTERHVKELANRIMCQGNTKNIFKL